MSSSVWDTLKISWNEKCFLPVMDKLSENNRVEPSHPCKCFEMNIVSQRYIGLEVLLHPLLILGGHSQPLPSKEKKKTSRFSTISFFCNMSWVCIVVVVHLFPSSHPVSSLHFMRCFKMNYKFQVFVAESQINIPFLLSISYINLKCCGVFNGNIVEF